MAMRFVIIGGDAAGMSAASRVKRRSPDTEVTVLEMTNDVSYSACGMPYNIADPDRSPDDLVVRSAAVFREKQQIDLRLGHTAEAIDRAEKSVTGRTPDGTEFSVQYDKLLIATGARAIRLPIPGADLPGVLPLKSLEDARRIKAYVAERGVKKALIVGMGYVGLELAEAFHLRGIQVVMIDVLPRLLPWMPEEMADVVKRELEEKGVELRFSSAMEKLESGDGLLKARVQGGEVIDADLAIMAVGVKPNSEIAADAGLELGAGRAVAVDKLLRTSDPDIYAAGDCADAFSVITGKRVWVPLALRANRGGWAVADNVLGGNVQLPGIAGSAVFKVLDLEVARTGLSVREAEEAGFHPVETIIKSRSRAHSHPGNQTVHVNLVGDAKTGRLLGGILVGKEGAAHRIDSVAVALHAGMTVPDFAQCDMAYAPPFSPVWDPLLTAANQLLKGLG